MWISEIEVLREEGWKHEEKDEFVKAWTCTNLYDIENKAEESEWDCARSWLKYYENMIDDSEQYENVNTLLLDTAPGKRLAIA